MYFLPFKDQIRVCCQNIISILSLGMINQAVQECLSGCRFCSFSGQWFLYFIALMIKRVFLTANQNCHCSEFFLLSSCPLLVYIQEETGFFIMSVSELKTQGRYSRYGLGVKWRGIMMLVYTLLIQPSLQLASFDSRAHLLFPSTSPSAELLPIQLLLPVLMHRAFLHQMQDIFIYFCWTSGSSCQHMTRAS